jgi:hypothetical protein
MVHVDLNSLISHAIRWVKVQPKMMDAQGMPTQYIHEKNFPSLCADTSCRAVSPGSHRHTSKYNVNNLRDSLPV